MKVGFFFSIQKTSACMNYATLKFEAKSHCVFARSKKHLSSLQIHCEKRRPKTKQNKPPKCWLFRAHKSNQHLQMGGGVRGSWGWFGKFPYPQKYKQAWR